MTTIRQQTPWESFKVVVFALFVREMGTRFGRYHLGYLWAILEPVSMVAVFCGVRLLFGAEPIEGLNYPVFFASGILSYLLFQHIAMASLSAVEANIGLFNYQPVRPMDAVVSRALLEICIFFITGLAIFPALAWAGFGFHWNDTLLFFAALAGLLMISLGLGLALSVLGPLWQESKKIVPVLLRPLFFISGVFFSPASFPPGIKEWVLLNPLVHAVELMRRGMAHEYTSQEGSLAYLFGWGLACLYLGLAVYRLGREKVVTSGNIR